MKQKPLKIFIVDGTKVETTRNLPYLSEKEMVENLELKEF
jgi:hypothetical protein